MDNYFKELDDSINEVFKEMKYSEKIIEDVKLLIRNYMSNNFNKNDVSRIIEKIIEEEGHNNESIYYAD